MLDEILNDGPTTHSGIMAVEAGAARDADYAYQAYQVLRWSFALAPILAGLDKFFHLLKDWQMYLAPAIGNLVGQAGVRAGIFMQVVGAVEIVAGFLVLLKPRVGAYVVAGWLAGIIVNLLLLSGFYDIALRDFGLCLGAIALGRLSHKFGH